MAEVNQELSPREIEILGLVATGATNQQIARALFISPNTVKTHLRNVFVKLDVESRTEATLYAIQNGMIEIDTPESEASSSSASADSPTPEELVAQILPVRPEIMAFKWAYAVVLLVGMLTAATVLLWPAPAPIGATTRVDARLLDMGLASASEAEHNGGSRWTDRASMPTPRGRFAQAAIGSQIVVIGGVTPDGVTGSVDRYDVEQNVWSYASEKPTAVANIGAALVHGRVYVPGGLDGAGRPIDLLEIYDPERDLWDRGADLPVPLCAYAIVPHEDGFYLFGGWDGESYLDSVYYYDAMADTWRLEHRLSVARGFIAAASTDGVIVLTGGYDGNAEYRTAESYDPERARAGENPWRAHAPMRHGRAGHVAVEVLGNLYVLGGGWQEPLQSSERLDISNDVWTEFETPISGEWRTLGGVRVETTAGTFVYGMGGWSDGYLSSVKAYQAFYRVYLP